MATTENFRTPSENGEVGDPYLAARMNISFDIIEALCSVPPGRYAREGLRAEDIQQFPMSDEERLSIPGQAMEYYSLGSIDGIDIKTRLELFDQFKDDPGLDRDEKGRIVKSIDNVHFYIEVALAAFDPDEKQGRAYLGNYLQQSDADGQTIKNLTDSSS